MKVSAMMRELALMDSEAEVVIRIRDDSERDGANPHEHAIVSVDATFGQQLGVEVWVKQLDCGTCGQLRYSNGACLECLPHYVEPEPVYPVGP